VIQLQPKLAENQIEGLVTATPAILDHAIFLRTDTRLYLIGKESPRTTVPSFTIFLADPVCDSKSAQWPKSSRVPVEAYDCFVVEKC